MVLTAEERERERALFESERRRAPALFDRPPMVDTEPFRRWIGIEAAGLAGSVAYLRLMPQDFLVEEMTANGAVETVDTGPLIRDLTAEGATHYATLVKIGISTLEAKGELAHALGIDEKQIGFAGIKDRLALTAQRISIRGTNDPGAFERVAVDNLFLKDIVRGKGAIANGDLKGNRFTITLRTPDIITHERAAAIRAKLDAIKRDGFWNFFSFQRFGTPRLISHWLGLLLVKGAYEETVKTFLTYAAPRELPYFQNIRSEIAGEWQNWSAIRDRLAPFPYHFGLELALVNYLVANPGDFLGALRTIPDQVRLWFYAYDCFLFNRKLSQLISVGDVPVRLPLITSFDRRDWEPYQEYLEADGVRLPSRAYRDFPFVRVESRAWPTLQHLEVHAVAVRERLAAFSFSLLKGSYATTFLMNFFTLGSGLPVVPGIAVDAIDARELLGTGTLAPTLARFRIVLERRAQDIAESNE